MTPTNVLDWILLMCLAVFLTFVGVVVERTTFADGQLDYCYVDKKFVDNVSTFVVVAHRPWRTDTIVKVVTNLDDAVQAASTIQCPLK